MMLRLFSLVVFGVFWLCVAGANARPIDKDMLPDEQTAKKVGESLLETYIGKQAFAKALKKGDVHVLDDGDSWVVFLTYRIEAADQQEADKRNEIIVPHGMRLPELHLSKHDGRVIEITLSRD